MSSYFSLAVGAIFGAVIFVVMFSRLRRMKATAETRSALKGFTGARRVKRSGRAGYNRPKSVVGSGAASYAPCTAAERKERLMQIDSQKVHNENGLACISGEALDLKCQEMTNAQLADFLEQGAWRTGDSGSDFTALKEAAARLRNEP